MLSVFRLSSLQAPHKWELGPTDKNDNPRDLLCAQPYNLGILEAG